MVSAPAQPACQTGGVSTRNQAGDLAAYRQTAATFQTDAKGKIGGFLPKAATKHKSDPPIAN
jgi:hypothetical protein